MTETTGAGETGTIPADPLAQLKPDRGTLKKVGVGAAIGSAAIVAALLYANYGRKK